MHLIENKKKINYRTDHVVLQTFGGAMENWGLITYSEKIYLVSNETSSAEGKLRSAYVIAHELAHMVGFGVFDLFSIMIFE